MTSQRTTALLEATLNHMNYGVAMFDQEQRLINCNDRYGQLYGLTPDQLLPGTTLGEIVDNQLAKRNRRDMAQQYRREAAAPVDRPVIVRVSPERRPQNCSGGPTDGGRRLGVDA